MAITQVTVTCTLPPDEFSSADSQVGVVNISLVLMPRFIFYVTEDKLPALISKLPENERIMTTDISIITRLYFQHVYLPSFLAFHAKNAGLGSGIKVPKFSVHDYTIQAVTLRTLHFAFHLSELTDEAILYRFLNKNPMVIRASLYSFYRPPITLLAEDDISDILTAYGFPFEKNLI